MKYTCEHCGKSFDNKEACVSHEYLCSEESHLCRLIELTLNYADGTYEWSAWSVTDDDVTADGLFIGELEDGLDLHSADKRRLALAEYHADMTQREQKQKLLQHALEHEDRIMEHAKAVTSVLEKAKSDFEAK